MMRLMGAMEIFTAQQQEDIKDEVRSEQKMLWNRLAVFLVWFVLGRKMNRR